ncbi:MAG: CHAT domain-containing protein [Phaeodactylibacter sp.]|nr:CHAT domain-containing protein [Phaeodactylibacter sp.]
MALPDILILGMANTPDDYLDQVQAEVEGIRTALAKARQQGYYEPKELSQFTFHKLLEELNDLNQSRRVTMLHYTGHSHATGLLAREGGQDKLLHADKLRAFLAAHNNLRFVFLNSCYSEAIAEQLADAGVPVVIGTDSAVKDATSLKIATVFYETLGGSSKTIRQAFEITKAYYEEYLAEGDSLAGGFDLSSGQYPWHLYCREEKAAEWRLVPESVADQLERSEGMRKLLIVRANSDQAKHFAEGIRASFSAVPNLIMYDLWELDNEEKQEKKEIGVDKADIALYLSTDGLDGALEGPLNWAKAFLKDKERHFILNGSGFLDGISGYLKKKELVADTVKIVAPFFSLEAFEKQINLDTALRGVHGEELMQLFDLGGIKPFLKSAIDRLNFEQQKQVLNFDDKGKKVNFILIEGTPDCGHELLVRKILAFNNLHLGGSLKPVYLNVEKLVPQGIDEAYLWMALNSEFVGTLNMAPQKNEVCLAISQRLKQQDVVVILDKVKVRKEAVQGLKQLVLGLWEALNQHLEAANTAHRLFVLFAHTGYVPGLCTISTVALEAQNPICRGLPVPAIQPLDAGVFNTWFIDEGAKFPAEIRQLIQQHRDSILEKKFIRKVVKEVCELLKCEEIYDEVFQITSS